MNKVFFGLTVSGFLFLPTSYGCGPMDMMEGNCMKKKGMMNMSMTRHHFVMRNGLNKEYANKTNPLQVTADTIKGGETLYEQNCASCHGTSGQGDGELGKSLSPRPTNIVSFSKMPMATDGYLFWAIAEGGVPLKTAMPPFKSILKEGDIWKIIIHLRHL